MDTCPCPACRSVDVPTLRRDFLDMISWSVGLFRRYPGVLAIAVGLVILNRLPEMDGILPVPWPVMAAGGAISFLVYFLGIRGFMAAIAAAELSQRPVRYGPTVVQVLKRFPALIGLLVVVMLVISTVSMLVFIASIPAFALGLFVMVLLDGVVGDVAMIAAIPLGLFAIIVFLGPPVYILFKAWLSIEACVIGNYGPVESLRISWRVSTSHRGKLAVIVGSAVASSGLLILAGLIPMVGAAESFVLRPLQLLSSSIGEFIGIMWYAIYAHVYVQGILTDV